MWVKKWGKTHKIAGSASCELGQVTHEMPSGTKTLQILACAPHMTFRGLLHSWAVSEQVMSWSIFIVPHQFLILNPLHWISQTYREMIDEIQSNLTQNYCQQNIIENHNFIDWLMDFFFFFFLHCRKGKALWLQLLITNQSTILWLILVNLVFGGIKRLRVLIFLDARWCSL